jgi:predicted transposase YdaD
LGWTAETLRWKVVEAWQLSAEELLAAPFVGTVPWATLARYEGPPEVLLQRCRERIDREGGAQTGNLLAVAQVFAHLHFNKPEWLKILGERKAMIESPLIQEIVQESRMAERAQATLDSLEMRFGTVPPAIRAGLEQVKNLEQLIRLFRQAANCVSLQAFEEAVRQELPAQPPPSTRGKRRSPKPPA